MAPREWLIKFSRIADHHTQPFAQRRTIFQDTDLAAFLATGSMPQKWYCRCGQPNGIQQVFCGRCGTRWNRASKPANPKAKGKPVASTTVSAAEEPLSYGYSMPSLELAVASSMQTPQSSMQQPANQKSLRAVMHQRANRAGKVENRIAKVKQALHQVQTTWPAHVQKVHATLQADHQKATLFCQNAMAEIRQLQIELADLTQGAVTETAAIPAMPPTESNQSTEVVASVKAALDYLAAQGFLGSYVHPDVNMEAVKPTDMNVSPNVQLPSSFHLPCVGPDLHMNIQHPVNASETVGSHPVLPSPASQQTSSVDQYVLPQVPLEPPPGRWDRSPGSPVTETYQQPLSPPPERFPNPLFRQQAAPVEVHPVTPVLPHTEVAAVVQEAEQGLRQMHSLDPHQELPQELHAQLLRFAQQQQQCHEQLQHFDSMHRPAKTDAVQDRQEHSLPQLPIPSTPQPKQDSISIASSPDKAYEMSTREPEGQRIPKVLKSVNGSVQTQPTMLQAFSHQAPLPASPTPSMVPTEIAESETEGQALQQLE